MNTCVPVPVPDAATPDAAPDTTGGTDVAVDTGAEAGQPESGGPDAAEDTGGG